MHRIALALAFAGVLSAGCGGSVAGNNSGGDKGVADGTFTVAIQNGQGQNRNPRTGILPLELLGGYVVSTPAGINCGEGRPGPCEFTFPNTGSVTLTAFSNGANLFNGWAGDCTGLSTCTLSGKADKYVLATFGLSRTTHPNFGDPKVHDQAFASLAKNAAGSTGMNCLNCHGTTLAGAGLAPACGSCHAAYQVAEFVSLLGRSPGWATAGRENCAACHTGAGAYHQSIYNRFTDATLLAGAIDSIAATALTGADAGLFSLTVRFTLTRDGTALTAAQYTALGQKRLSMTKFENGMFQAIRYVNPADGLSKTISFGTPTIVNGMFQTVAARAPFNPNAVGAPATFLYFYFSDSPPIVPSEGHYFLPDNTVSMSRTIGTINWTSTANASACTKCHGSPYAKHGYRQAVVDGLNDFVACKACHYDDRGGVDFNLAMTAEDPARLAALEAIGAVCGGELCWSPEDVETYAYTATTMQDTHISHAKEFLYPQSMANCATCHEGKLDRILTDANFTGATCKSCHLFVAANGNDPKRAPLLTPGHHNIDWVKGVLLEDNAGVITEMQCNECHNPTWRASWPPFAGAPTFAQIHNGFDPAIYAGDNTRYTNNVRSSLVSSSFAANRLTLTFDVTGTNVGAIVKPTVVASLYGYDTKDFLISGHSSQFTDKTPNLEWAEGATVRGSNPPVSANTSRLTVTPNTAAAGVTRWTATIDVSSWASRLADGSVKRMEIGFLPQLGLNQGAAPQCDATKANYNKCIAVSGLAVTYDLVTNQVVADAASYGKGIVDTAKCNKCHDALAVSFHSPNYGSAGVVGCRLCHVVGSGGSHLEMQSRSIDSYVHAIHSFQAFDIQNVNFADTIQAFQYGHHTSATYPNFTTLNCESCHNPGTYEAPAAAVSLPGILSASSAVTTKFRNIKGVPSVITGPGSRACGGCHRAQMIKADDALKLDWFNSHTGPAWGFRDTATTNFVQLVDGMY